MDDWLRDGLRDIASGAPTALEVPSTLRRRARGRMTITILTSLAVVVALGISAVAGVRSLESQLRRGDRSLSVRRPIHGSCSHSVRRPVLGSRERRDRHALRFGMLLAIG